jgi:hypothetical protein
MFLLQYTFDFEKIWQIQIYSLQATTPNYSNRVLLTMVCLFITNYLAKLSVKSIKKFKKILRNFLLEKSFYSVEEFMTADS